ncbi:hypothetical protein E2542_SST02307 [Spatholobus suberectus]|nr:hypothetical protein E2542_SST02307 [Spatholobus suberectus]
MAYYTHVSEVERDVREPSFEYSTHTPTITNYHPHAHRSFTEKVVYEEDVSGGSHHHRHHHPETPERVKVVEYEQVPERRVGEVVYEEKVGYETDRYYSPRSRPGYY